MDAIPRHPDRTAIKQAVRNRSPASCEAIAERQPRPPAGFPEDVNGLRSLHCGELATLECVVAHFAGTIRFRIAKPMKDHPKYQRGSSGAALVRLVARTSAVYN